MTRPPRPLPAPRGFTLIELLVAISIILIITGLLFAAGRIVQERARIAGTIQRIQTIERNLAKLGTADSSNCYVLQRDAAIGGVLRYAYGSNGLMNADGGAWLDYTQPEHLRFPWGQKPLLYLADEQVDRSGDPEDLALDQFETRCSVEVLTVAGILPETDPVGAYSGDRNPNRPWNDRWGRPLVVGYALFQYGPDATAANEAAPPSKAFNRQWRRAHDTFGYTRAAYIAIGAAGHTLDSGIDLSALSVSASDREACLAQLWSQICRIANTENGDSLWATDAARGVNAQVAPPWKGVRTGRLEDRLCLISAPIELR